MEKNITAGVHFLAAEKGDWLALKEQIFRGKGIFPISGGQWVTFPPIFGSNPIFFLGGGTNAPFDSPGSTPMPA